MRHVLIAVYAQGGVFKKNLIRVNELNTEDAPEGSRSINNTLLYSIED
jgi:hypothetical protein